MSLTSEQPGYIRHHDELFEEERRNPQPDHTHELYLESLRLKDELSKEREQHRQDINTFLGTLQQRYRPSPSVREADRRSDEETGYYEQR
jgi:hypothetical protein